MDLRVLVTVLTASALSLATPIVQASPAPTPEQASEADQHVELAIAAFGEARYEDAAREFRAAFAIDHNPNHLFNIGRVYEEAGDLAAAVDFYKQFVAQPAVQIDHRSAALERIDVLERALATQRAAQQPEPEPTPATTAEPESESSDAATEAPTAPEPAPRSGQRKAGWALFGVGATSLVAGVITTGVTAASSNRLSTEEDPSERERLADRGSALAPASDALVIAGSALALVGLIVALTARPKRDDRRNAILVEPRGVGFSLRF